MANRVVLTSLIWVFAGFLGSQQLPGLGDPVSWREGGKNVTAWPSLDEVALFPRAAMSLEHLAPLFHARAKRDGGIWIFRTEAPLTREVIAERITALRREGDVQYAGPVFYLCPEKNVAGRTVVLDRVIARYRDDVSGAEIEAVERRFSLARSMQFSFVQNGFLYQTGDAWAAIELASRMAAMPEIAYAYPGRWRHMQKRDRFTPNDPRFPNQWHLKNTGQKSPDLTPGLPGEDVAAGEIESVWESYRGDGVVIAIMDDGVDIDHPDLSGNTILEKSRNYAEGGSDPSPPTGSGGEYAHGTAVAGCVAASGNNGLGVVGVAFAAKLVGYRIVETAGHTDANEADALGRNLDVVDIHNNSWGPKDGAGLLEAMLPLSQDAVLAGITYGRGGKGFVYVWAGGNGGDQDNSNYDGYANSRYTIAVAASDFNGKRASYSEKGANILVSSPSLGDYPGSLGIVTTDLPGTDGYTTGNYYNWFDGTSAAAPIVSGCVALMLQANMDLTWRDVQHVLVESADHNDPADPDWTVNAAGKHINHKYGFGRVNVKKAIDLAGNWVNVGPVVTAEASAVPNAPIPDNHPAGVSNSVAIAEKITIEQVEITFTAGDHPNWTELEVELIAPSGTRSILAEPVPIAASSPAYDNWQYTSVRHWGENSEGVWTLVVRDLGSRAGSGNFESWKLTVYGTSRETFDLEGKSRNAVVHLEWADVTGASNFKVQRKSPGGRFDTIAVVGADVTEHSEWVGRGQTFIYRVWAVFPSGKQVFSNEVVVSTGRDRDCGATGLELVLLLLALGIFRSRRCREN